MEIQWTDFMSTGIEKLDEQHKELINMINELGQALQPSAMEADSVREKINNSLTFLVEYARKHFELEEEYFKKYNCPNEINRKEHREFLEEFLMLTVKYREEGNELLLGVNIYTELSKWLLRHIMEVDVKLYDYVQKAGDA